MRRRIASCLAGWACACLWAAPVLMARGAAAEEYDLDQRFATIGFRTGMLGLMHPEGNFPRFRARLSLDFSDPRASRISVVIDDSAIHMGMPGGADMLRSVAYFDTAHYPTITFRSTAVQPVSPGHFTILGVMTIRGVEHPEMLEASFAPVPGASPAVAELRASGVIDRSDFGMVADQAAVSNEIVLTFRTRLQQPIQH